MGFTVGFSLLMGFIGNNKIENHLIKNIENHWPYSLTGLISKIAGLQVIDITRLAY